MQEDMTDEPPPTRGYGLQSRRLVCRRKSREDGRSVTVPRRARGKRPVGRAVDMRAAGESRAPHDIAARDLHVPAASPTHPGDASRWTGRSLACHLPAATREWLSPRNL